MSPAIIHICHGFGPGRSSFPIEMAFQGNWRTYQTRLLDRLDLYLEDKRLHVVAAPGSGLMFLVFRVSQQTLDLLLCLVMVEILCRGLLFDLDGVLVDSTPAVARVWTKWALKHGLDPEETVRNAHGRPSLSTIRDLMPNAADPIAENEIILRGEIEDTEGVVALPGVLDLLKSIPKDLWALVTSCARPLAHVRLIAAGIPIPEKIITADDVRRGKPDPEPYVKGAALLGIPASECLVFEDAPAGIRAGKSAGARVIALPTTESEKELRSAGADWVLPRYANLSLASANGFGLKLRLMA